MTETRTAAERIEAAHVGRARQPYFLVVNYERGYAGMSLTAALPSFEYSVPKGGARQTLPLYGLMSNTNPLGVRNNIFRSVRTEDGYTTQQFFNVSRRLAFASGDLALDADRELPAEWFFLPEPIVVREDESLNIRAERGGVNTPVLDLRTIFLSEILHKDETGRLTESELDEIIRQVNERGQRTFIAFLEVSYADEEGHVDLALPELDEWAYIVGFASGEDADGNVIKNSYVRIGDPNGREWSNDDEGIPVAALCSFPFDANNTQVFYRKLITPYLVGPRRENATFTFFQGGGNQDVGGRIAVLMRTA